MRAGTKSRKCNRGSVTPVPHQSYPLGKNQSTTQHIMTSGLNSLPGCSLNACPCGLVLYSPFRDLDLPKQYLLSLP